VSYVAYLLENALLGVTKDKTLKKGKKSEYWRRGGRTKPQAIGKGRTGPALPSQPQYKNKMWIGGWKRADGARGMEKKKERVNWENIRGRNRMGQPIGRCGINLSVKDHKICV